ncbi:MAG: hypothetical protein P8Y53_09870 [Pseudolabrys sp.]|jgi:hypothetical protein
MMPDADLFKRSVRRLAAGVSVEPDIDPLVYIDGQFDIMRGGRQSKNERP